MIPIRVLSATIAAVAACALFTACKKHDWGNPIVDCRIVETADLVFEYNQWGDPVSVKTKVDPDATGNPSNYFEYDAQRRLIAYRGGTEHYYTYNAKGQAAIDTMIMNYAGQDDRYERRFYYDHLGRIVRMVQKQYHTGMPDPDIPPVYEETTTVFKYDLRGNLVTPGVSYDNKTSLYRTHPVWMLVNLNFSMNNPVGSSNYNSQGLPGNFNGQFLGRRPINGIIYSCGERAK